MRKEGQQAAEFIEKLRQVFETKGYAFFERGDYNLNILGIRNQSGKADHFDDKLCVVYKVDDEWVVDEFQPQQNREPAFFKDLL